MQHADERLPVYAQLRDSLASRIANAEWAPGELVPPERRLAQDYTVSIGTVRKAVDGLVAEGLLERRQGLGTYVRRPSFDATLFRFFQVRSIDGSRHSIPSSQLVLRVAATAPKQAGDALGTRDVIRIVRVRSLADQPVLYEEIHVPRSVFAGFETLPEAELGPLLYPLYFEHFGVLVARATDDLSFGTASATVAKRLGLDRGDPVAVIRRTAFDRDGTPVEWRIARGSAARFRYRSEID